MDCLEAQAILSAAHDGEPVDPKEMAEVQAHCSECPDCATFAEGLRYLDVMPAPHAPADTIKATLAAVAAAAAERAEAQVLADMHLEAQAEAAETAASEETANVVVVEPPASRRFPWLTDQMKWGGIGAVAAIAATALVAFIIVSSGAGSGNGTRTATSETAPQSSGSAPDLTFGGGSAAGAPAASAPVGGTKTAPTTAPDYVMYNDVVYSPGALLADSSTATPTIGSVVTAFASAGAPQHAPVFASPLSDGSIVVQGPDGYRLYAPVIRMLASKKYQLAAGNALDRFGIWPTLPPRFTAPTSADGSPTFTSAGVDALGVRVYAATGQPVGSGFAIAPNGPGTDPAGGNPNWTWWQPVTP